jgi:hypothetical protein
VFRVHSQYIDTASGFHVIEMRDERGSRHLLQIAIGYECCPACGAAYPKDNLGEIDPKAAAAEVGTALDRSRQNMAAYALKHGVKLK